MCKIVRKAAKIGMYVGAAKMAWWLWEAACYESMYTFVVMIDIGPGSMACGEFVGSWVARRSSHITIRKLSHKG